MQAPIAGTASE